ncbi:MAG: type II toxin-antitoxin system prevent-host-death family antitoxin [Alphaproteobacteria bacterium]|nr:type II toxin-antitoxin system prevent-host-death family antitoxin [Alphaproteobacteria bacterium]MBV8413025.1 type II toxin-antitoxin system prevent-host-death family antitoxin [Alphaproteobacteria bacterium]
MRTIDILEAETERAAVEGEGFIIARGGMPLVKVIPIATENVRAPRRLGFLAGEIEVPDDFDRMGQDAIERQFGIRA